MRERLLALGGRLCRGPAAGRRVPYRRVIPYQPLDRAREAPKRARPASRVSRPARPWSHCNDNLTSIVDDDQPCCAPRLKA